MTLGGFALARPAGHLRRRSSSARPHPLVRLGILRTPALVRANVGAMALFGGYVAFQFIVTLYLQDALGWSRARDGDGASCPAGLIVAFGAPRTGALINRIGTTRPIAGAGHGRFAVGYVLFLRVGATPNYARCCCRRCC